MHVCVGQISMLGVFVVHPISCFLRLGSLSEHAIDQLARLTEECTPGSPTKILPALYLQICFLHRCQESNSGPDASRQALYQPSHLSALSQFLIQKTELSRLVSGELRELFFIQWMFTEYNPFDYCVFSGQHQPDILSNSDFQSILLQPVSQELVCSPQMPVTELGSVELKKLTNCIEYHPFPCCLAQMTNG